MTANAKNLSTLANVLDDGTNGQFLQSTGSGGIVFANVAAGASVYDSVGLLPMSGNDAGDMAYVTSTNRFYINNGSGWYSISLVNTNPNITSVQDAAAAGAGTTPFTLTTDGTATVITITANDPEDIPLTYGYSVTSGSLTNGGGTTATVGQGTGEGYAISSASILSGTYAVNANVGALTFKPDGTEMYTASTNNDRANRFTLSTAWDVSTASYVGSSPNTLTQVTNLTDVKFNNNGTKMYMADRYGTTNNNTIYQYSLSTAWDISTASYDSKSYDFTSVLTGDDLNCFVFNADGTSVYLAEHSPNSNIYQFTLSTPFDISTASYASKTLSLSSVASNGYVGRQYFQFTNDGSKLFLIHTFHPAGFVGKIYEYSLTTAYDISTASHTGVTYTPAGITAGRSAIAFKPDGSRMFIMGTDNHTTISQFNLPIYSDNQFTITPTTTEAYAGTFSLTFTASDGINTATSANSFTLSFITNVTDSKYTTLLATATGTSDNNNITDASTNNHSITVNGDAHAGTFSPYRSGGYSNFFGRTRLNNPSGDPTEAINATLGSQIGTGDFSVSYWVWVENPSTGPTPSRHFDLGGTGIRFYQHANTTMRLQMGGGTILDYAVLGSLSIKSWHYVSVTRNSGTVAVHFDGILAGSTTNSTNITQTNFRLGAGTTNDITFGLVGYVRDFMIKNAAVYSVTENYTVPDAVAVPDSNTLILLCSLPYHTDASSNNLTLDLYPVHNGTAMTVAPEIHTFSPYDYPEYDAADHGGSVYFDGTGDYIEHQGTFTLPAGTNANWTIECWVNLDQVNLNQGILRVSSTAASGNNDDIYFSEQSGYISVACKAGGINSGTSAFAMTANTWHHIAMVKNSGTIYLYNNGVYCGSLSDSNDYSGSYYVYGGLYYSTSYCFAGYLSDFRISNSAIYTSGTSNFTTPTAPLSSSGTLLHIKGTDASIVDKSQGANLKLVGNTTGSTTQVKFANTKSMYFDGTGDYLSTLSSDLLRMGTGNFTVECWVNKSIANHKGIWQISSTAGGLQSTNYFQTLALGFQTGIWQIYAGGGSVGINGPSFSLSTNTWYHTAVVRNSGTTKLYIDGTEEISISDSHDYTGTYMVIGGYYSTSYLHHGYIQDLRVTKGLARYTANFTPPTAPLEG